MAVHRIGRRAGIHGRHRIPQENNGRNILRRERERGDVVLFFFSGNHELRTDKSKIISQLPLNRVVNTNILIIIFLKDKYV